MGNQLWHGQGLHTLHEQCFQIGQPCKLCGHSSDQRVIMFHVSGHGTKRLSVCVVCRRHVQMHIRATGISQAQTVSSSARTGSVCVCDEMGIETRILARTRFPYSSTNRIQLESFLRCCSASHPWVQHGAGIVQHKSVCSDVALRTMYISFTCGHRYGAPSLSRAHE